jgi:hypothetical protein
MQLRVRGVESTASSLFAHRQHQQDDTGDQAENLPLYVPVLFEYFTWRDERPTAHRTTTQARARHARIERSVVGAQPSLGARPGPLRTSVRQPDEELGDRSVAPSVSVREYSVGNAAAQPAAIPGRRRPPGSRSTRRSRQIPVGGLNEFAGLPNSTRGNELFRGLDSIGRAMNTISMNLTRPVMRVISAVHEDIIANAFRLQEATAANQTAMIDAFQQVATSLSRELASIHSQHSPLNPPAADPPLDHESDLDDFIGGVF